jgi:hypothetical protein
MCSCQDNPDKSDLFELERHNRGHCTQDCVGQYCGQDTSVYVVENTKRLFVGKDCEELFMYSSWPPTSEENIISNGLNDLTVRTKIFNAITYTTNNDCLFNRSSVAMVKRTFVSYHCCPPFQL